MNPLSQIGILVIQTLGGLYLLVVMLRFLLQIARADFYNPLSQFIAKATNPLLVPLRRVIPGLFGLDLACLLLAMVVQFTIVFLSGLMIGLFSPLASLLWSLLGLLSLVVYIYFACMIIMIIISWVAPYTRHPFALLSVQLVRPLCAPLQRLIPPMGGIDISPIFVFLLLNVARVLIDSAAASLGAVGMARMLVPGLF